MRNTSVAIVALSVLAGTSTAEPQEHGIRGLLRQAVACTGTEYLKARDELLSASSNVVPALAKYSSDTNETWQTRLMAGIVTERIQRGKEIAELMEKDWRKDPEYDQQWDRSRAGPIIGLMPLLTKRYKEKGLWFYYLEMLWKETGEHWKTGWKDERGWCWACREALSGSPKFDMTIRIAEERIRRDPSLKKHATAVEWQWLVDAKTNAAVPFILDLLPLVGKDETSRHLTMLKMLKNMAQPDDVPLFEKYFKDKGQVVPDMLRESLMRLKSREESLQ